MRREGKKQGDAGARRRFLPGNFGAAGDPIRPPWSWDEKDFLAACTRCDACASVCPKGIIVRGLGGFPEVDFSRGECSFCGDCAQSCRPGALVRAHHGSTPWLLKAAITPRCIAHKRVICSRCGDACARRAIRFRPGAGTVPVPEVDRTQCKGCGACLAWCSVSAIVIRQPARAPA